MDEERFDEITRSLGDGADRRGFLRRLAALTFGGLTAVVSTRAEASKKPKPKPNPKPKPKPTCGHEHKYCDSKYPCCDGFTCYKGRCHDTKPSPPPPPKPGICPKGADACSADPTCGEGCSCATTVEGRTACRQTLSDCANPTPCNHSKDCPGGLCVIVDNCCPPPKGYAGICSTTCDDKKYRD
jgi:hypothetical protein